MKKTILIFTTLFFILINIDATSQVIKGSGKIVTDNRELTGFNELIAQGSFNLILTQGEKEGVRIVTDDNVVELFQTRVDGKKLYITMVADVKKSASTNVYVSVKELVNIILLSEISLKTETVIHFDELNIFSGGLSQLNLEVYAASLKMQLTDGTYTYLKGYTEKFAAEVHDETELNAFEMQVDYCDILASGLTEVMIDVQKELKMLISGGSNLYYTGNPVISQRIFSSTGFIVKRQKVN
jgi:hypothetical protein